MNAALFTTFVILNILNVIIQTVKSLATVKCSKGIAALVNAIAYGLYTVVLVYMTCDLPLLTKAAVVAACNLVGVYVVKDMEERIKKDKIWKIEATVPNSDAEALFEDCTTNRFSFNNVETDKWTIFNIFASTKEETTRVKQILTAHNAKYFTSETKEV